MLNKEEQLKLSKLIETYKFLDEKIKEYTNELSLIENIIVDTLEVNDINAFKDVFIENVSINSSIKLKDLKEQFNNDTSTLIDELVITININDSLDSLRYLEGMSEPILNAYEEKLSRIGKVKTTKLRIDK